MIQEVITATLAVERTVSAIVVYIAEHSSGTPIETGAVYLFVYETCTIS